MLCQGVALLGGLAIPFRRFSDVPRTAIFVLEAQAPLGVDVPLVGAYLGIILGETPTALIAR